jgi:hypothetical protein
MHVQGAETMKGVAVNMGPQISSERVMSRDIFVTERAGTPFRKIFLRSKKAGTALRTFFP